MLVRECMHDDRTADRARTVRGRTDDEPHTLHIQRVFNVCAIGVDSNTHIYSHDDYTIEGVYILQTPCVYLSCEMMIEIHFSPSFALHIQAPSYDTRSIYIYICAHGVRSRGCCNTIQQRTRRQRRTT